MYRVTSDGLILQKTTFIHMSQEIPTCPRKYPLVLPANSQQRYSVCGKAQKAILLLLNFLKTMMSIVQKTSSQFSYPGGRRKQRAIFFVVIATNILPQHLHDAKVFAQEIQNSAIPEGGDMLVTLSRALKSSQSSPHQSKSTQKINTEYPSADKILKEATIIVHTKFYNHQLIVMHQK